MVTLARRKRHFFSRGLFLSALLTTIWLAWRDAIHDASYTNFTDLSAAGNALFETFSITQLFAVIRLVPALTAPVIAAEKDRDTLGLLMMSNLSRHNILLDKLVSRILLTALLLVSALPVLFVLLSFGGITVRHILLAYLMIFSTIIFCCGVGLLASTLASNMRGALIGTYVGLAGYVVAVFLSWYLLSVAWPYSSHHMGEFFMNLLPTGYFVEDYGRSRPVFDVLNLILFPVISIAVFVVSIRRCKMLLPKVAGTA
jgi:ABC-type transport system involved in multi-copper enzyme maturation permease subunit